MERVVEGCQEQAGGRDVRKERGREMGWQRMAWDIAGRTESWCVKIGMKRKEGKRRPSRDYVGHAARERKKHSGLVCRAKRKPIMGLTAGLSWPGPKACRTRL